MSPISSPSASQYSQIGRARQHIDLRASIIGVVFARDIPTGKRQQLGITSPSTAPRACAACNGPVGIGRDILNIDRPPFADVIAAIAVTSRYDGCQFIRHSCGATLILIKPGPAISISVTPSIACRWRAKIVARSRGFHPGRLGQHHRRIAGKIAMRGIAWQFEDNSAVSSADGNSPSTLICAVMVSNSASNRLKIFIFISKLGQARTDVDVQEWRICPSSRRYSQR